LSQSKAGPLYLDSPHCQGENLVACSVLGKLAWLATKGCWKNDSASILFYSDRPKGMLMAFFWVDRELMVPFLQVNLRENVRPAALAMKSSMLGRG
jgi:hypothetical protein